MTYYTNIGIRELEKMPLVDRAKMILSLITKGEWVHIMAGLEQAVCTTRDGEFAERVCRMGQSGEKVGSVTSERYDQMRNDAEFIVRAPALIRDLIDEISYLKGREYEDLSEREKESDREEVRKKLEAYSRSTKE